MSEPRLVEVRRNVLKQNDVVARALREQFRAAGVFVVSLVSSPGSGKTTFLEKTLTLLQPRYRVAALVGDLATENDAIRLARSKAPVPCAVTRCAPSNLSLPGLLERPRRAATTRWTQPA